MSFFSWDRILGGRRLDSLKLRVAREAALLLYTSQEKEYKQAKQRATHALATHILPSNAEVAEEIDKIADEIEGSSRIERLLQMRQEALTIMDVLKDFHPKLIGSVWRGTANKNSDIDVVAFSSEPANVLSRLQIGGFNVIKTEWQSAPKHGGEEKTFHVYLALASGHEAEVVVRALERINRREKCEIYGDTVIGLNRIQLRKVLDKNPLQKFIPKA
jgi:predicted nucleotidyltransferase